ncbi:hypothetical protein OVY29_21925 [Sphingopyxis sp. SE2]|uniref:zonular occludens toxin domain-containing protein n=1 Tax=Sphingopyxis sp. SE2 TaxID=1586240 RepID=UPI0028C2D959|nr:zonular occludens toxin domain-containing protein [Sphingopyxis sp. SE2]MDT7531320.1 hypothetical protein [Sphingopyxis sp. SE2]
MQYFIFGPSGSGKTTEAYSQFIWPALQPIEVAKGDAPSLCSRRKVYGNVPLNLDVIADVLGFEPDYTYVSPEEFRDPLSWPVVVNGEVVPGKVFGNGGLIVIDECHDIFSNRSPLNPRILSSISMQRHFSDENAHGIDIVWISQTKRKFHSDIRENGEAYYKVYPRSELGKADEHVLSIYSSWDCRKDDMGAAPRVIPHDKTIYPHYRSVAQGVAGRKIIDERIKALSLKHWLMLGLIPLSFSMVGIALYYSYRMLSNPVSSNSTSKKLTPSGKNNDRKFQDAPRIIIGGDSYCISTDSDGLARVIAAAGSDVATSDGSAEASCDRRSADGDGKTFAVGGIDISGR